MNTIQIRPAVIDQADLILAVIIAAFEQYRDVLDPPSGVFKETSDDIRHKLATGGGFVAVDGDQIVGAVLFEPHMDHVYLGRLAVLPNFRGRQIASQLIMAVEQAAIGLDLYSVQLAVRVVLTNNRAFFQRLGYSIKSYQSHEGFSEYTFVTMEKALVTEG